MCRLNVSVYICTVYRSFSQFGNRKFHEERTDRLDIIKIGKSDSVIFGKYEYTVLTCDS